MYKYVIISCAMLIVLSCKKKDTSSNGSYTPTCTGTKSFSGDVFPLIKSNCWSCHNNMSNHAQISAISASIKDMVISGIMPKNSSLTNAQKDIIVCWIEAGTPNN